MLYAPGRNVTVPALVSFTLAVMPDSCIGEFFLVAGLLFGPFADRLPVCAPPTAIVPVGVTTFAGRSTRPGLFDAALTVFQVMVMVSPTTGEALELVRSAVVVPWITGRPETLGGVQLVAKLTFAASAR